MLRPCAPKSARRRRGSMPKAGSMPSPCAIWPSVIGRSPMGLYRYFRTRDEIVAWLRTDAFTRFSDALEHAFSSGSDAFARARAVGRAYLDFALANPQAYRLMFDMSQPDDSRLSRSGRSRRARQPHRHPPCRRSRRCRHRAPAIRSPSAARCGRRRMAWWCLHLAGRLPPETNVHDFYLETMRIAFRGARATARTQQSRKSATR